MEEKKEKKTLKRVLIGLGLVGLCVEASRDFKEMKAAGDFVVNTGSKIVGGVKSIFGGEKKCAEETQTQQQRTFEKNDGWKRDK